MADAAFKVAGITGGMNHETGLISFVQPWWIPDLESAFSIGEPYVLEEIPMIDRSFGVWDSNFTQNGYQIGIRYEGIAPGGPEEREGSWEYDGEWKEEPIEKHWNMPLFKKEYGAYFDEAGKLRVPEFLPKGSQAPAAAGQGFGLGSDADEDIVNPLLGHETYPLYLAVYSRTYLRRSFPVSVVAAVGSIIDTPEGILGTPEGRNWLFTPPRISKRGNAIEVTERLKMSPPGGWPEAIFDLSTSGAKAIRESPRNRATLPARD